jgi:hypothetical protein
MSLPKMLPILVAAALVLSSAASRADDDDRNWPCTVALCLANPKGATNEPKCRPPIKKLFRALQRGEPFPVCKMSGGSRQNDTSTQRFTAKNCPQQYRYFGGSSGTTMACQFEGAITYRLDEHTRVRLLWNEDESISETLVDQPRDDDDTDEPRRPGQQLR